ncbi:CU044_5270 family protein [Nocardioides zeae]|uniref:Uncharacterized protein n=1 Tax=Nocardioides zeae TaxID=1457234 RepID=A0A6P0HGL1_9ACTN|nr:CU044_5270 family protein [Nocardioides zeae]NEN77822.1 hypothetical protein [Nocardioides zeae]
MPERPDPSDGNRPATDAAGHEHAAYDAVESELTALLSEQLGVPRHDLGLSPEQRERSEQNAAAALARITATPPTATPAVPSATVRRRSRWVPSWRSRWTWGLVAALVAVVVAVSVTIVDVPGTPTPAAYAATPALLEVQASREDDYPLTGTDPSAALERLATTAAAQPGFGTGDTQVVTRVGWWLDVAADRPGRRVVVPVRSEVRQLPDDTTRIVVRRGEALRAGDTTVDPGDGPVTSDEVFPRDPGSPLEHPERLPTDPAALAAVLLGSEDACVGFRAYCLAEMVSTLNLGFVPSPELEAGLIRTLVGNDDITYAGTARDRLSRDVDVFAVEDPDDQRQYLLMFDPRTGYFVGRETVLLVGDPALEDVEPPAVVEFDAVVDRRRDDDSAG